MKSKCSYKPALLWLAAAWCVQTAAATFDDIQFWVGTGPNRAALVLDWNDNKSPESLLWGFRWDGNATGLDMLQAVVTADPRLFAHSGKPGPFGVPLYGIGYDANADGFFDVSPQLGFDSNGWSVGDPDDLRAAVDAADHWAEGWNLGFWGYNLKTSPEDSWTSAMAGPSGRTLSDGAWDGYSFAPGFSFSEPSEPMPAPVPEPAPVALLFLGGCGLIWVCARRHAPLSANRDRVGRMCLQTGSVCEPPPSV